MSPAIFFHDIVCCAVPRPLHFVGVGRTLIRLVLYSAISFQHPHLAEAGQQKYFIEKTMFSIRIAAIYTFFPPCMLKK